jgi:hypothetical protein
MNFEDIRTPKHYNDYANQGQYYHPKSEKFIKGDTSSNVNRSYGYSSKHYIPASTNNIPK